VRTVHVGPVLGLAAELAVVAALSVTVGLGALAWLVGAGVGLSTAVLLSRALIAAAAEGPTPADVVTLGRAALVGGVAALTAQSTVDPGSVPVPVVVGLAAVALVLDNVDGRVARRTGRVTELGARFDMEVDAFLIAVLSVLVVPLVGWWVLAIGLARYAYVVAGRALAWLRRPVPPRYWRKVVAAVQGVVLTVVAADVLPGPVAVVGTLAALALLTESFGRDVVWQWHRRAERLPSAPAAPVAGPRPMAEVR
jgi:phosphatidylglycerophosphate synthase